jgi:hypothetical protein
VRASVALKVTCTSPIFIRAPPPVEWSVTSTSRRCRRSELVGAGVVEHLVQLHLGYVADQPHSHVSRIASDGSVAFSVDIEPSVATM